jgi:hypothetical protein
MRVSQCNKPTNPNALTRLKERDKSHCMARVLFLLVIAFTSPSYGGQQRNTAAQRDAMKKLDFLAGKWSGDAAVIVGPGEPMKVRQTEEIQYKLDGLVMLIEGTARNAEGQVLFQALATISYDDSTSTYRFRAYHDGNYLDTELAVKPKGFAWGYTSGPVKVSNVMQLDDKGAWSETTEVTVGSAPPRKSVEMNLRRQP